LELELYRQAEEKKFRQELQAKEAELLSQLAAEWKRKEKDRESLLKRKMDEVNNLEIQFQKLITDLEGREKKLDQGEEDLIRRQQEVERELERRIEEARDATRRLQEEFRHRLELEKQKTADVEAQKRRVQTDKDDLESRYKALESEFIQFKRGLGASTEAQLRAEVNSLVQSKAELEKQVVTLNQSKKHYKTEWMKALASLAKIKKEYQAEQEAAHLREKREVQRLKIQYMAKEELGNVDADRQALRSLRKELDEIKNFGKLGVSRMAYANMSPSKVNDMHPEIKENMSPEKVYEIERLTKERDSLLKSGAYHSDDRIIRELNLRISELLV
jgi:centrosomal protein CEP120